MHARTVVSVASLLVTVRGLGQFGPPGPPPPFDDHAEMMKQLGIRAIRPGPNPNNQSTFDEAVANPFKESMPDVLRLNNGEKVTRAEQWRTRRREIAELFEREVYGRIPRNAPKVRWEVTGVTPGMSGGIPVITKTLIGHVDNRSYPKMIVDIQASFTVPAHSKQRVPIMMEFGFGGGFGQRPGVKPWGEQAIERGWGYGTINPNSIQPDNNHLELGVIGLCNKGMPRKPEDWGALRAWGWGLSRQLSWPKRSTRALRWGSSVRQARVVRSCIGTFLVKRSRIWRAANSIGWPGTSSNMGRLIRRGRRQIFRWIRMN